MVTNGLPKVRAQRRRHGSTQRFRRTLHHITRNKTINKLQQLERELKNSLILRTHHHDPRPPRILTQTVRKSSDGAGMTSEGFFGRSFASQLLGSSSDPFQVVVHCPPLK